MYINGEKKWKKKTPRKTEFHKNKKVTETDEIDVNKILVSKEVPYGIKNSFKYFIGYNDNVIRPLWVKLPQMIGYAKKCEVNLAMCLKISDKELLEKYDEIWERIKKLLEIKFDSKHVYGDDEKYIKQKKNIRW